MAEITQTFRDRWLSRRYVGPAKPTMRVEIRTGRFLRRFSAHVMLSGQSTRIGYFPYTPRHKPWHAYWTSRSSWKDVPNVMECRLEQDFENNGVSRLTLTIENIVYAQRNGFGGIYHAIEHGYLAPLRGYTPPKRPGLGVSKNDWYNVLGQNAQIRVYQGYGNSETCVFTGLLDDIDTESHPDRVVVTGRDFGQLLTDQRFMGWVKDRHIKDPVTFADRRYADNIRSVGGAATASSSYSGHTPRYVTDGDMDTAWISDGHNGPNFTEWVEVKVPEGRYEDVYVAPRYANMEAYVSVFAKGRSRGRKATLDGKNINSGWVNVGLGNVPGGNGGHPFMRQVNNMAKRGRSYRLNHILEVGADSTIRVSFRGLSKRSSTHQYHAGVRALQGRKRARKKEAKKARWILVDDASDIVKIILRWCGFQEWEIESTGVRLKDKMVFNRSDFLIDAVKKIAEMVNYVFYIGDPSSHTESRGVPIFRSTRALKDLRNIETISDRTLLTGIKTRFSDESLAAIIRVRGKLVSAEKGGRRDFVGSGGDTKSSFQAFYRPPWARESDGPSNKPSANYRLGGLIKHVVHYDRMLASHRECHIAARFIAAAEALAASTAIIEIPPNPGLELDDQVYLLDRASGMATRLWISNRASTFTRGEKGSWQMSLAGALIDTPDLVSIRKEIDKLTQDDDEEGPVVIGSERQGR